MAPEQHLSSVKQGLGSAMGATGVTACRHEHLPSVNGNSWRKQVGCPEVEEVRSCPEADFIRAL